VHVLFVSEGERHEKRERGEKEGREQEEREQKGREKEEGSTDQLTLPRPAHCLNDK